LIEVSEECTVCIIRAMVALLIDTLKAMIAVLMDAVSTFETPVNF
jgi:hypothetical protein